MNLVRKAIYVLPFALTVAFVVLAVVLPGNTYCGKCNLNF